MKTYTTQGQTVEILAAHIQRASGYGQYTIVIDFMFNGKHEKTSVHSTNSRLFDNATDEDIAIDGHSEYVMEYARYTIEAAIDDYVINERLRSENTI